MMRRFPTASITLALSAVAIFLSGCPDPQGVADDFVQNRAELDLRDMSGGEDPPTDGGMETSDAEVMACRAPADVTGTYVLAVLTALDPGKPLLLKADVVSDLESDPPTVKMTVQPLESKTRHHSETSLIPIRLRSIATDDSPFPSGTWSSPAATRFPEVKSRRT